MDGVSKELNGLLTADLIHINRYTQQPEPALASSWAVTENGRRYTLHLRRGLRFSDGHPFDADDVLFTFRAYTDPRVNSPQRDLLIIGGKPIAIQKLDPYTVAFVLPEPYAVGERLFDSIAILPRHLLERAYEQGELSTAWNLNTAPSQVAGLGPFQLQQYLPGQQISLVRNKFYWKADTDARRLPYLDGIVWTFSSSPEAQEMRFAAGGADIISRFDTQDYPVLEKNSERGKYRVYDAGPGLEYSFLGFNLNDLKGAKLEHLSGKQKWFRQAAFRRAISCSLDREAMVRLAYGGRAYALLEPISPGNKVWMNRRIPQPVRSVDEAKRQLIGAGFRRRQDGSLEDRDGTVVEFSILYNSARLQQERMATIMQQDLKEIGIKINVIPLDFASLMDRVLRSFNYEAAIMALVDGDADPNAEMNIWLSNGTGRLWEVSSSGKREGWESEIDGLMREQMTTVDRSKRKQLFDRVQELIAEYQPVVFLLSPNIVAGAAERVGNFQPTVLSSYTLWNAEQLFVRGRPGPRMRQ